MTTNRMLRLPEVIKLSGLSRSSVYLRISQGQFPPPVSLGSRSVAWPQNEIELLNKARISGQSNEEIKNLIAALIIARKIKV